MCRHSSRYFDHMSVSFLWNKESQQDFYRVKKKQQQKKKNKKKKKKKLVLLSFLRFIFLFPVFLYSFIVPFTDYSVFFVKSIFDFLLSLIVDIRPTFSRLFLSIVLGVRDHFKTSWIII